MTANRIARTTGATGCRRASAIVASLVCLLPLVVSIPAWAGRPLDTEDTATLDPARAELELSLALTQDSGDRAWAGAVALNVGVAPRLELGVELPGAYLQREGIADQTGIGDLVVVLKHLVLEETEWRPALLANLRLRLPTGDADRGLGAEGVDVLARLGVSKAFASLTLTLNGGYVFVTADRTRDVWLVSGSGEYRVSPAWTVVGEIASVLGALAAPDVAVARVGVVYALTSAIRFDMAVGTGLTRASPSLVATAGITIGF
jgi:hypothetical protein